MPDPTHWSELHDRGRFSRTAERPTSWSCTMNRRLNAYLGQPAPRTSILVPYLLGTDGQGDQADAIFDSDTEDDWPQVLKRLSLWTVAVHENVKPPVRVTVGEMLLVTDTDRRPDSQAASRQSQPTSGLKSYANTPRLGRILSD